MLWVVVLAMESASELASELAQESAKASAKASVEALEAAWGVELWYSWALALEMALAEQWTVLLMMASASELAGRNLDVLLLTVGSVLVLEKETAEVWDSASLSDRLEQLVLQLPLATELMEVVVVLLLLLLFETL